MDKTAIQEINSQCALNQANNILEAEKLIALPDKATMIDLSKYTPEKRWFSGRFNTSSVVAFCEYVNDLADDKTQLFISMEEMHARAIFNIVLSDGHPGRCDNNAILAMIPTPEMIAINKLCDGSLMTQRDLAEWMEEWVNIIMPFDTKHDMTEPKTAISAIRSMTVESSRKTDLDIGDMNQKQSTLDQIEAKGKSLTVAGFDVSINCYDDLPINNITVIFSVLTTGNAVKFKARMLRGEKLKEKSRLDLRAALIERIKNNTIYLGTFQEH